MSEQPSLDLAASPAFDDGKDAAAFRTIGEVAKAFNLKQHVLRYWEEQFPMLRPLTRAGGRRYYRPQDVALIAEISRLLYREGFTIKGARKALAGWGKGGAVQPARLAADAGEASVPAAPAGAEPLADQQLVASLRALRDALAAALNT